MNKLLAALILLFYASPALAQTATYEANPDGTSSQRVVVEAVNRSPTHMVAVVPDAAAPRAPAQPVVPSGIGPSSNMAQPGDYGYSYMSDLRQLNF